MDSKNPEASIQEDQESVASIIAKLVSSPIDLMKNLGITGEEVLEEYSNPVTEPEIPHLDTEFNLFENNNMAEGEGETHGNDPHRN